MKKRLLGLIPISLKKKISDVLDKIENKVYRYFIGSRWLASFYYFVLSSKFHREHQAVLAGRRAYEDTLLNIGKSCTLLRRNIHRLEKGLIMRPRRPVFGEAFIQETIDCFGRAVGSDQLCAEEFKWVKDVLIKYFQVVHDTPVIKAARLQFDGYQQMESDQNEYVPYPYGSMIHHEIPFNQLQTLFLRRRSVRWYQDKIVPFDLLQQAVNAASLAPSACNRQPYQFYISTNKSKAAAMAKCAGGTKGFADNLPCVIAVVGDLSAYPMERDRHVIYIDGALAAMQLMLALETLGLATCAINWPDVERAEQQMQKLLKLENYQRPIMLLAVGYADVEGEIPFSQKKTDLVLIRSV